MQKVENGNRFWNRWFDDLSVKQLEDYLISQAALWKEDRGKYPLEELQLMTFREIFGFLWCDISPKHTSLPVTIYLDEVGICDLNTPVDFPHFPVKPKIMIRNNYDTNYWDVIPITISKTPEIMEDGQFIKISDEDIEKVKSFIIKNYDLLMKHWRQEITTDEIYQLFQKDY